MTRGVVVQLTDQEIVNRALYLAGELTADHLDEHVQWWPPSTAGYIPPPAAHCEDIYYLLREHNGGKDPTARSPADHWSFPDHDFTNVTSDCVGGGAWCGGWDRYQPARFGHVPGYDGWINTDSALWDARGPRRCFVPADRPEPGSHVVCESGSLNHAIGHWGVVVKYGLAEWDPKVAECWHAIEVVNVAAYHGDKGQPARANRRTTGAGWFGTGAMFLRSIMK